MILRPQYTQRPLEILLIGPVNSGKRTLAEQLIKCRNTYISINTIEGLSMEYIRYIKSCDYVLIIVDLLNRQSLSNLREALSRTDSRYLVDRCAVVITKVDAPMAWMMDEHEVQNLVDLYVPDIYVFRANLTDEDDCQLLCDRIARIVRISALQQKGVTTALIKSAVYYSQIPFSARSIEQTPYEKSESSRILPTEEQQEDMASAGSARNGREGAQDAAAGSNRDDKDEDPQLHASNGDVKENNEKDSGMSDVDEEQQTAQ
ncbi:hypothetical protein BJV82DRAFT_664874 [Fennellomyces sp. T-0311]|nr:hypothetical protein BJV82DRAFT_664874 [Fennellomyces sp. T-0311]